MATYLKIKKGASGETPVFARVQVKRADVSINLMLSTGVIVNAAKWEKGKIDSDTKIRLEEIKKQLDAESKTGLTSERAKDIIRRIVYAEQIAEEERIREEERKRKEDEKRIAEEQKRVTFMDYYRDFLEGIKTGNTVSEKGTAFAERSRINYQQGYNKLVKYQNERGCVVDWDSLNMSFFDDYSAFLRDEGYNLNTISKRFTEIKTLVHRANDRGITDCMIYANKSFNVSEVSADSIYLTRDEIEAIKAVDLSKYSPGYEQARDLFLVGIWTAQRISDYNDIKPEDIRTVTKKVIVEGKNGEADRIETVERVYIDIVQKKTGARVTVPCNAELRAILAKYNNRLPHLCDQVVNRYIKELAKAAGLNQLIKIHSTKGGKNTVEKVEKWKLVHSHTARRTGATLMYLAGIDTFDICRITGHASEKMLKKYIKSNELENAQKFSDKYDYFN